MAKVVVSLDHVLANFDEFNYKGGFYKNGKPCYLEMRFVKLTVKQNRSGKLVIIIDLSDNNVEKIRQLEKILPCDIISFPNDDDGCPINKPQIMCHSPKKLYMRDTKEEIDISDFIGKTFLGIVIFQNHIGSMISSIVRESCVLCDLEIIYIIEMITSSDDDPLSKFNKMLPQFQAMERY